MADKNVNISPIITEKSMKEAQVGKYSFVVDNRASKTAIKEALGDIFKVNVVKVRTNIFKGRRKRVGTRRTEIKQPAWKKAIVELKKGEKISLFEPAEAEKEKKKEKL